jgi:hypothetical protein
MEGEEKNRRKRTKKKGREKKVGIAGIASGMFNLSRVSSDP